MTETLVSILLIVDQPLEGRALPVSIVSKLFHRWISWSTKKRHEQVVIVSILLIVDQPLEELLLFCNELFGQRYRVSILLIVDQPLEADVAQERRRNFGPFRVSILLIVDQPLEGAGPRALSVGEIIMEVSILLIVDQPLEVLPTKGRWSGLSKASCFNPSYRGSTS